MRGTLASMKHRLLRLAVVLSIGLMVSHSGQADPAPRPNILFICVDDLRPDLRCFGAGHMVTPHMDRLASLGRAYHRHYVQAPTCGASRYAMLTGQYGPYGNDALFRRAVKLQVEPGSHPPSLPAWFRQHGYMAISIGKVSHHPGGRGGPDWDNPDLLEMPNSWDKHLAPSGPWQHPRGAMHGLAHGEIREIPSAMALFQSVPGLDEIFPDGLTLEESIRQLRLWHRQVGNRSDKQPLFMAVGILKPHLPFGAPEGYADLYKNIPFPEISHPMRPPGRTTWHASGEFMKYERWGKNPNEDKAFAEEVRRHYAACVSYADSLIGRLISELEMLDLMHNTIVVLWGDHGWHLGEHAIWGKHSLFEESLRSPLIIVAPGRIAPGQPSYDVVESIDLFPTLCELAGLPVPEFLDGQSLLKSSGDPYAVSYTSARTIRSTSHRFILHPDGFEELYDHTTPQAETQNVAPDFPGITRALKLELLTRLSHRDRQLREGNAP